MPYYKKGLTMKLYKRNNIIYADYIKGGKRYRQSLKLEWNKTNLNYARVELIPKLMQDKPRELMLFNALDLSLELDENYLRNSSLQNIIYTISSIKKMVKDRSIQEITVIDIEKFSIMLSKQGYCSNTIKNYLMVLSKAFRYAIKQGIITFNPVYNIKVNTKQSLTRVVYSKEDIPRLINSAKGELRLVLLLAFYSGARIGEILALTSKDISSEFISISKTIAINTGGLHPTKTNKPRVVYIPKDILTEFTDFKGFTMSYQRLGRAFQNLCNALDLPYAGFHSLRHTYASLLLNDKVNPLIIKEALGHSSMKMLEQVYGHFTGVKTEDKEAIKASLDTIRAHQD